MSDAFPFDAVIFDCDGVLVDSERIVNDAEAALLARLGLSLTPSEARARFKGRTVNGVAEVVQELLGHRLPADWCYDWGIETALVFTRRLRAVPGVREVIDELAGRGVPIGVASQSPPGRVALSLTITGLDDCFDDRVFTASMVPRAKPCPDVFLLAAARLGAHPSRCAVIEDSPSGVVAAVAAGMSAFGFAADENRGELAAAGAVAFTAMPELPALLARGPAHPATQFSEHPRLGRLRDAYERLTAGDVGPIARFLADDVVYHLPGKHLGGGTLAGRAAVLERMARAAATCDEPASIRLTGGAAAGDLLLSTERFVARRRSQVLDQDVCVVWRMRGEQCAEIWACFAHQAACDRFWDGL